MWGILVQMARCLSSLCAHPRHATTPQDRGSLPGLFDACLDSSLCLSLVVALSPASSHVKRGLKEGEENADTTPVFHDSRNPASAHRRLSRPAGTPPSVVPGRPAEIGGTRGQRTRG